MAEIKLAEAIPTLATETPPAAGEPQQASAAAGPPVEYETVKFRKPDGTIVTRRRPIVRGSDVDAAKPSQPSPQDATQSASPPDGTSPPVEYKIVKVRKPDGTIAKVRRPIVPGSSVDAAKEPQTIPPAAKSGPAKPQPATQAAAASPLATTGQTSSPQKTDATSVKGSKGASATQAPSEPIAKKTASSTAPTPTQTKDASSESALPTPVGAESKAAPPVTQLSAATTAPPTSAAKDSKTASPVSSQSPQPDPTTTTQATEISPAQVGTTFNVLRNLGKFHKYGSRTLGVFDPDYQMDDWNDGDEEITDSDDTDDDDDDDDDDGGESPDSGQDDDYDEKHNGECHGQIEGPTTQQRPINEKAVTETTQAICNAALPPSYGASNRAANGASVASPKDKTSTREPQSTMTKRSKSEPIIQEKEVPDNNGKTKPNPRPPRELTKAFSDLTRYFLWAIMIILPLLFIVLGIITATLTNNPAPSAKGDAISQANKIAVSAWPIIFAAIAAQSLKALATYKVERGIRLMSLEQLISSHSVASAVKQPFILRRMDLLTIALLCLWSLSPLASSAMQRLTNIVALETPGSVNITYVSSVKNLALGNRLNAYSSGSLSKYFTASMLPWGPSQYAFADLWDSPQVPLFSTTAQSSKADSAGWYPITNFEATVWSSNLGLPIAKFWTGDNTTSEFTAETSQLNFTCPRAVAKSASQINFKASDPSQPPYDAKLTNSTSGTLWLGMSTLSMTANDTFTPWNFTLVSQITNETTSASQEAAFAYAVCHFNWIFVDTKFHCDQNICHVTHVRLRDSQSSFIDPGNNLRDFSASLVSAAGISEPGVPTLLERWLGASSPSDIDLGDGYTIFSDLTALNASTLSERLSTAVNTYWQIGFAPMYQAGNLIENNTHGVLTDVALAATVTSLPVYATDWGWLAALFICSVALLISAVVSIICDVQSISPDVLGFASSVARKSKYVDLPKVDTAAGGAERARLLGQVRVMMQDVKPKADVGRIALGTAHEKAERLQRGRMYR